MATINKISSLRILLIKLSLFGIIATQINLYSKQFIVTNSNILTNSISESKSGDTILIKSGAYILSNIVINKKLHIIGENYPVFEAKSLKGDVITVFADSVIIEGLKFQNITSSYISDNAAIKLKDSHNSIIRNNIINNSYFGIYLAKSTNCKISNNRLVGNKKKESASGNGIHLWKCNRIDITHNDIKYHRDGIYFEFVTNGNITHNLSQFNVRYGLHFMFSDSCRYNNNKFIQNGAGVAVMYTKNVIMEYNLFEQNWGTAAYGLLLKDIRDSKIVYNNIINNTIGIYAEGSDRIIMNYNNFTNNGWAFKMMGNCVDNKINFNNFSGNSFDVATNSMENYNSFEQNYWSKYNGYDLNKDGVGEISYYPVTLFSMIIQESGTALLLMHSLFVNILEIGEKVFPSIIPKKIVDNKPFMNKIDVKYK